MSATPPATPHSRAATRAVTHRILHSLTPVLTVFWLLMILGMIWISLSVAPANGVATSLVAFIREPGWWLSAALGVTVALTSPAQYVTVGATRLLTARALTRATHLIALANTAVFAVLLVVERLVAGGRNVASGGHLVGYLGEPETLASAILSTGGAFLAAGASGTLIGTILYRWAPRWQCLAVIPALAPVGVSMLWHAGSGWAASAAYGILTVGLVVVAALLTRRILTGSALRETRPRHTTRGAATS
ncbi:hypothetical protein GCM10022198_11980 [Klugiella xanthotipulae]|uniref:Uncharacterized protein n=1 Tax=Klugiella xanthotipulae TaxID=244735 RepID=A0A543I4T2_9MICO|nr:hypothetical protein [Klugiella xanthotipulae]TQM65561.1 hypothetical protein FB466_0366 [Klugiella xanthotipulae]